MMKPHIPDFSSARLLVIGDLMLDRYWHGDTSRISPEAPVPVVLVGQAEERPGGAGNVALNIARLGAHAALLGLTGEDEAADALEQRLSAAGVQCRFERLSGFSTVTKLRVLSRHQQLIRLDFEDGFRGHDGTGLMARFHAALDAVDVVVCSDYGKGSLRAVEMLIDAARAAGKPVVVDPKGSDFNRYRGAMVITPNQHEFEAVVGRCENDEELVERGQRLCQELDLDALLITRSERGMTLLRVDQPALHVPTHAREVFDVTGAGDTVVSVLATALAAGQPLDEAMALANLAAGVVVGKLGTASVSVAELHRAMREIDAVPCGAVDEGPLLRLVQDARAHGETVVMTNGCFDILHAGHVAYLRQARERGDRLIVAVNDDASVARLKGERRPINDLEGRMAVLAGLESVDWVVSFTEDTPERLICAVLPDVLVKGGDYRPEQVAGGRCVQENGGEVVILDFIDGRSTSRIIDTIRAQSD